MTPKEKALELVNKFDDVISPTSFSRYKAKNCAIIAADEMVSLGSMVGSNLSDLFYIYWQEVKTEINNL